MENIHPSLFNQQQQTDSFDVKEFVFLCLSKWYLFVLTLLITLSYAYYKNKTTLNIYKASATFLIPEQPTSVFSSSFLKSSGLSGNNTNLQNELGIITSYKLVNRVLSELNSGLCYYRKTKIKTLELHKSEFPFIINVDTSKLQPLFLPIHLKQINDNEFTISLNTQSVALYSYSEKKIVKNKSNINFQQKFKFGDTIKTDFISLMIQKNEYVQFSQGNEFYIIFNDLDNLTLNYQSRLTAEMVNKDATLVKISISGTNSLLILDFLNRYGETYLNRNLEQKNSNAIKTIAFINSQLGIISDSLSLAENKLVNFRSTNRIIDLSIQAQAAFAGLQDYDKDLSKLQMKKQYYLYLKDYFKSNKQINDLIAPSTMGVEDPLLEDLITLLLKLNLERTAMLNSKKEKSVGVQTLTTQIEKTKQAIEENIENQFKNIENTKVGINQKMAVYSNEIEKLPTTEKELLGFQRNFKLNNDIYTFLLQKKAEAQLSKASNSPDIQIIDNAQIVGRGPIGPNRKTFYTSALIIGFAIPLGILFLIFYLNKYIKNESDVKKKTNIAVLGEIIHNKHKILPVVNNYPQSTIAENFRSIRTNLQFFSKSKEKLIILLTSSIRNEGKTFNSVNLAYVFALFGKKTLLLGFDLRKKTSFPGLPLSSENGLSNYLVNQTQLSEVIQKSELENLDIIVNGPIPPNPAELIASEQTTKLFSELKSIYEYIIIDTPPIGLVSDAYLLMKESDLNIFVVRMKKTPKTIFGTVMDELRQKEIPNMCLLLNDVNIDNKKYGYEYGYKYNYYYNPDEEDKINQSKKGFKKFILKLKQKIG